MKPLIRDIGIVTASHALGAVLLVAMQVILARTLAPRAFGEFLVVQATILLLEVIVVSRSGEVAQFLIGRHWNDPARASAYARLLRRQEWRWNLSTFAVLIAAAIPLCRLLEVDPALLVLFGITIPVQSGYGVSKAAFIAAGKLVEQALLEITLTIVGFTAAIGALMLYGLYGFVAALVMTAALKSAGAWYLTRHHWLREAGIAEPVLSSSTRLSAYSIVRNVSASVAAQIDVLVLGMFGAKETVAVYKIARTLAGLPTRGAAPVWAALRPRILDAMRSRNVSRFRRLLLVPAAVFGLAGVVAAPLLWWLSPPVIGMLYGEGYRAAATPFVILLAGTWFHSGITGWLSFVAVITNEKRKSTLLYLLLAAFSVTGAFLAGSSAVLMAVYIAAAMLLTSSLAWYMFMRSYFNADG